jgi:LEA14-like dessication related protein
MKNKGLIVYGGAVLLVAGVGIYLYKQYSLLMDGFINGFKVISGAIIKKLSANEISFTLIYKVTNKGDLGVTVTNQKYSVYINNTQVSTITNSQPLKIKGGSTTSFPLNVDINPQEDLSKVLNLDTLLMGISNKNSIVFKISGVFSFSAGILKLKDFPFEETFTLADLTAKKTK